jgi:hypothetical protein
MATTARLQDPPTPAIKIKNSTPYTFASKSKMPQHTLVVHAAERALVCFAFDWPHLDPISRNLPLNGDVDLVAASLKVTYNSKPKPSSVEEGAQALAEAFESEGWGSLEDLRQNSWAANELVDEMDLEPKLEKRMLASLSAIRDSQADFEKAQSLECDTIDERSFNVQMACWHPIIWYLIFQFIHITSVQTACWQCF